MPYDIRIISGRDFIQFDAEGHLNLATSQRLLCDAIYICTRSSIGRVLIDVRDVTSTDLTAAQLMTLADVCRTVTPAGDQHKIAILNRPKDNFNRAEFLASAAEAEGWNIRAFQSFEEAFHWLIA